jgi:hypothetical protein
MHKFCFNDCMPLNGDEYQLISGLKTTLIEYNKVKTNFPEEVDGIVTGKLPSQLFINSANFSLSDCIEGLERPIKRIAYAYFNKYPIDKNLPVKDVDDLITGEYAIVIDSVHHSAINAKIVAENEGILFTLAIHDDLKKNALNIISNNETTFIVNNLFGETNNTAFISSVIHNSIQSKLGNFEKLIALFGAHSCKDNFKRDFDSLSFNAQLFVIKEFQFSIERKAKTRFYPDDKLIKDVTPDNEAGIKIYELRIHSPVAIRIYFYETETKIFLASIDSKTKKKEQTGQIKNACSIIKELLLLEN